jgi:16S rRNA (cytosine967-C5)-methyltransferase
MPISPARQMAFEVLMRVEQEAAYASDLLHARLDENVGARDAALVTELVMGALRWQRELDFLIERYTHKKPMSLDREVLIALRLGTYQLRHLARIPPHAAVSESVELVKKSRAKSAASLVNAVLRRAAREKDRSIADYLPADTPAAERLGITASYPTWLVERWLKRFGEKETSALLTSNNQPPRVACSLAHPERRAEVLRSLDETGVKSEPGLLSRNAILIQRGNVAKSEAFRNGWIAVQDEASQLVPLLLSVRPGYSVLDLCAAPGGKTLSLARAAGPGALVIAADLHEHRLRAMRERLNAADIAAVQFVALDGTADLPFGRKFDRILLDAPCSGTGTLARNPEIRWRLKPADLADLHRRQVVLLSSALASLALGGHAIYSTCSLEPEENEQVLDEVLAAHPDFRRVPVQLPADALSPGVASSQVISSDGFFRTFPPRDHADGFFAAAVEHK